MLPAALAAVCLTALVVAFGLLCGPADPEQPGERFYHQSAIPMLTSNDGYYFLRLTQDFLDGRYAEQDELNGRSRPMPPRLIVLLTAGAARALHLPAELVAYYLPAILSLLMAAVYIAWGAALGRGLTVFFAALAGASAPFWLEEVGPGLFDLHVLTPFFFFLTAFFLYRFAVDTAPRRWAHLVLFLVAGALFVSWWWPGVVLCGLLGLGYALSLPLPVPRWEQRFKVSLLGLTLLGVLAVAAIPNAFLPSWLVNGVRVIIDHLNLAFKLSPDSAAVGHSIDELRVVSLEYVARKVSGHPAVFCFALFGLGAMLWRNRAASFFLFPAMLMALCSLRAERFILLSFSLFALGLGFGAEFVVERVAGYAGTKRRRQVKWGTVVLLLGLLVPSAMNLQAHAPPQPFTARDDAFMADIRNQTQARSTVWTWWDYGYFVQYRAGRATPFDGGMQTTRNLFVDAFPLVCADPDLAANWMHFFAAHGLGEFENLARRLGSDAQVATFLVQALSGGDVQALGRRYDLTWMPEAQAYLFPRNQVSLYLPAGFFASNKHWYWFGRQYLEDDPPQRNHLNVFPQALLAIDRKGRRVIVPEKYIQGGQADYGTLVDLRDSLSLESTTAGREGPYLVVPARGPQAYLADSLVAGTLAFRLLAPVGFSHPRFREMAFVPGVGGVWAVE